MGQPHGHQLSPAAQRPQASPRQQRRLSVGVRPREGACAGHSVRLTSEPRPVSPVASTSPGHVGSPRPTSMVTRWCRHPSTRKEAGPALGSPSHVTRPSQRGRLGGRRDINGTVCARRKRSRARPQAALSLTRKFLKWPRSKTQQVVEEIECRTGKQMNTKCCPCGRSSP